MKEREILEKLVTSIRDNLGDEYVFTECGEDFDKKLCYQYCSSHYSSCLESYKRNRLYHELNDLLKLITGEN